MVFDRDNRPERSLSGINCATERPAAAAAVGDMASLICRSRSLASAARKSRWVDRQRSSLPVDGRRAPRLWDICLPDICPLPHTCPHLWSHLLVHVHHFLYDRSFQYASPCFWNQLPASLHQPCTNLSNSDSPSFMSGTSFIDSVDSSLSSFITPHSFIPCLKPSFFCNLSHVAFLFFSRTDSTDSPDCLPILLSVSVFYLVLFLFSTFFSFWFGAVD